MGDTEPLWRELHDCRQDERQAQSSLVTILIGSTAVYGAVAYILFSADPGVDDLSDALWMAIPLVPLGLTGWFAYIVSQIVVRGRYMEALEEQIRVEAPSELVVSDDPGSPGVRNPRVIKIPAAHGLLLPIGSVSKGHGRMAAILIVGLLAYQVLPFCLVIVAFANMGGLVTRMATIAIYVPFFVLTSYTIAKNGLQGGAIWRSALESHIQRTG